ncbi:hypothetical protein GC169_12405 [bacterium]|nr:hypothetical protein [bacterium]
MIFKSDSSFEENLKRFRAEAERLDPECAKILFDNLEALMREGDTRLAVQEFNQAVLAALMDLP